MKLLENLDLNLLLLLHWLLEECSVTRAAEHVGISQPAASRGLQRLRQEFGDELLVRSGRTYIRSRFASSIQGDLATAMQHLRIVASMEDVFDPKVSQNKISIASNDYLALIGSAAWLSAISPQAPLMMPSWRPLELSVKDALASGHVDLAIIPKAARDNIPKSAILQDMVIKPLLTDRFVVFGGAENPALANDIMSFSAFMDANHILVSPLGHGGGIVDEALMQRGLSRHIAHRTYNFNHAADLAIMTESLTVIPERLAKLKAVGVYRVPPLPIPALSSDLVWHASRTSDKAHTWVRRQLRNFF